MLKRFLLFFVLLFCEHSAFAEPFLQQSASSLKPESVVVVVNEQDANSVEAGEYYLNARNIPKANLIKLSFKPGVEEMNPKEFAAIREKIYANLGKDIQVITLMWTTPFAVGCNSITSAVTFGFDAKQCENTCGVGKKNPYFNSNSQTPAQDYDMRLSILLPTDDLTLTKSVIDKGVMSEFRLNEATGYFLKTKDKDRSKPRERFFPKDFSKVESKKLFLRTISAENIHDKKDVMFYFTGLPTVANLNTLNFMPGAIADHLTSFGGRLLSTGQMSAIKWLEAGATGSYGSVSEPCNYWQKFPNPVVVLNHYLSGETLVEAYWKSVYWPTQGVFIGEPLAAPYKSTI